MRSRFGTLPLAAMIAATALVGCQSGRDHAGADKVGGSNGPLVLRLGSNDAADEPDTPLVEYFARQVEKLSGGKLRVRVILQAAGDTKPDTEARIAKKVRGGELDLGWIGARAWDQLGLRSFQALQAPFLIDNYAVLDRVTTGPLATEMLAGLKGENIVGLALVPELLRHPVGGRHPLVTPSEFARARLRDWPSRVTDSLLRALGATPVHVGNAEVPSASASGRMNATEASFGNAPSDGIVTANVTFFGKALTLFAGRRSFASLTPAQQAILRAAARRTLHHAADHPVPSALAFEGVLARQYCRHAGHVAFASSRDIEALAHAVRPVLAALERDAQTKRLIGEIRELKASLPPPPRIAVPSNCLWMRQAPRPAAATERSPSALNGTYRWLLTESMARSFGSPATDPGNTYPTVITVILRDGRFVDPNSRPRNAGTYTISGNTIVFGGKYIGRDLSFTFVRERDGSVRLKPVLPMERGDQFVWSAALWHRIGPAGRVT